MSSKKDEDTLSDIDKNYIRLAIKTLEWENRKRELSKSIDGQNKGVSNICSVRSFQSLISKYCNSTKLNNAQIRWQQTKWTKLRSFLEYLQEKNYITLSSDLSTVTSFKNSKTLDYLFNSADPNNIFSFDSSPAPSKKRRKTAPPIINNNNNYNNNSDDDNNDGDEDSVNNNNNSIKNSKNKRKSVANGKEKKKAMKTRAITKKERITAKRQNRRGKPYPSIAATYPPPHTKFEISDDDEYDENDEYDDYDDYNEQERDHLIDLSMRSNDFENLRSFIIPEEESAEGVKCPVCNKRIAGDMNLHLDDCLTHQMITECLNKSDFGNIILNDDLPKQTEKIQSIELSENIILLPENINPSAYAEEDVLENRTEECAICFNEYKKGDKIARLGCLCIFHKNCIDEWLGRKECCPNHPT